MADRKFERKPFTGSRYEDHERWEEMEHRRKDEYFGDGGEARRNAHTASHNLSLIESFQQRNKKILSTKGIGHSKNPKKLDDGKSKDS